MPNPFDLGPAANPIDTSGMQAARAAWYADRDRIVREVLPQVDRAIAAVEDWSQVVQHLAGLVEQLIPILEAIPKATAAVDNAKSTCALADMSGLVNSVRAQLAQLAVRG